MRATEIHLHLLPLSCQNPLPPNGHRFYRFAKKEKEKKSGRYLRSPSVAPAQRSRAADLARQVDALDLPRPYRGGGSGGSTRRHFEPRLDVSSSPALPASLFQFFVVDSSSSNGVVDATSAAVAIAVSVAGAVVVPVVAEIATVTGAAALSGAIP